MPQSIVGVFERHADAVQARRWGDGAVVCFVGAASGGLPGGRYNDRHIEAAAAGVRAGGHGVGRARGKAT